MSPIEKYTPAVLLVVALSGSLYVGAVIFSFYPMAGAVVSISVAAYLIRCVVQWFNRRDGSRSAKRPPDAP
jgi:hypothetical protein